MRTQKERLLDYLEHHKGIDPITAWNNLGIYRLSGRVCDLRQDGHRISTGERKVTNRYGEECRVAYYTLCE